jgi:hypothetical protein
MKPDAVDPSSMIEVQIESGGNPEMLADLIASTLHGHVIPEPESSLAQVGKLIREQQERVEEQRPSRQQVETVNFSKIDDEQDWTEV